MCLSRQNISLARQKYVVSATKLSSRQNYVCYNVCCGRQTFFFLFFLFSFFLRVFHVFVAIQLSKQK